MDAASNFVQSSFFSVFSPGRFPVLIALSDSFHKGVLSIVTFKLLNMGSVEKRGRFNYDNVQHTIRVDKEHDGNE